MPTEVSIDGENWLINGRPTHEGRTFRGMSVEGLLMNSRMANDIFDDANPLTRHLWAYPDTGEWDPDRNVRELIAQLPVYRAHGLDAVDLNLQGASPLGYYRSDEEGLAQLRSLIHARHPGVSDEEIWAGVPDTTSQPWDSGAFTASGDLKPAFMERAAQVTKAAVVLKNKKKNKEKKSRRERLKLRPLHR